MEVHYTGVNRLDTIQRKYGLRAQNFLYELAIPDPVLHICYRGVMQPPPGVTDILGLEMSGKVSDAKVENCFQKITN